MTFLENLDNAISERLRLERLYQIEKDKFISSISPKGIQGISFETRVQSSGKKIIDDTSFHYEEPYKKAVLEQQRLERLFISKLNQLKDRQVIDIFVLRHLERQPFRNISYQLKLANSTVFKKYSENKKWFNVLND